METNPTETPKKKRRRRRQSNGRDWSWLRHVPLVIFGLIVVLAPVFFGAVDRWMQIGLVTLLAFGLILRPPEQLKDTGKVGFALVFALIVAGQFIPWSGIAQWRSELAENLHVALPPTRHPEPARAVDPLLAILVGALWFQWVRTLAADRRSRLWMCGILAASGVVVAVLSMVIKGAPSGSILGLRPTLGWVGWGTFPNRNHTASFLGMAALMAAGLAFWSFGKRRWLAATASTVSFVLVVSALLFSKSRGGLVAFCAGLIVLLILALVRKRDLRTGMIVLGVVLTTGLLVAAYGGDVLARFTSQESGGVSNDLRRQIWSDAAQLWRDDPWFGHGLGTFPQLFPVYTRYDFDGQAVGHPESSWLLWLCEVGWFPLALVMLAVAVHVGRGLRRALATERRGFYLTAGALAGVAALLAHAVFDVPAHRWATLGFAVALLAVAFPVMPVERSMSRAISLLLIGIAGFWSLPYFARITASPTYLARLEAQETTASFVGASGAPRVARVYWEEVLTFFPVDPIVRQFTGLATLAESPERIADVEQHFAVARHLSGSSWAYSVAQARALGSRFPAQAITAWQEAVTRSGRRAPEVFRGALAETAGYPGAQLLWTQFVEVHPELALVYARALTEGGRAAADQARPYFEIWWEKRGSSTDQALTKTEIEDFHVLAASLAEPAMIEQWMKTQVGRQSADFRQWVHMLTGRGEHARAWQVYAAMVADPPYGAPPAGSRRASVEAEFRANPENANLAVTVAQHLHADREDEGAAAVILKFAQRPDAPVWVLRKAAHLLAAKEQYADAVALALRDQK
jgi:O-antigen ligase